MFGIRGLIGKDDGALAGKDSDRRAWSVNAAYEYPLSKQTTLWTYGAYAHGSRQLGSNNPAAQIANYNGLQAVLGMTHKF